MEYYENVAVYKVQVQIFNTIKVVEYSKTIVNYHQMPQQEEMTVFPVEA